MVEEKLQDNIYGLIGFNEHELKIIQSPLFQRLQWIRQMGPTYIVFPNAIHTRFSHSIGVFEITKRIIEQIKLQITMDECSKIEPYLDWEKDLRFAALLHDIGHVPFSHTGESVLLDDYNKRHEVDSNFFDDIVFQSKALHECMSAEIVSKNTFLDSVFSNVYGKNKKNEAKRRISEIIMGIGANKGHPWIGQILHSELDADRLDYLLRDATFIGKAYGLIDLDYLISKVILVKNEDGLHDLCVQENALQTVEHYILSRYFSKTQIIYNPKVAFLNSILKDILFFMTQGQDCVNFLKIEDIYDFIKKRNRQKPFVVRLY